MALTDTYAFRRRRTVSLSNTYTGAPNIAADLSDFPIVLRNLAGVVSTSGNAVYLNASPGGGDGFPPWLAGAEIAINGTVYTVESVVNHGDASEPTQWGTKLYLTSSAGTQTNVPYSDSCELRTVANGGCVNDSTGLDIVITDDTDTVLAFERVWYDPATGKHEFWLKRSISLASGAEVRLYYGGPSTDRSNKTAVWTNGYVGVWHFGRPTDTTLDLSDSTGNGNDGVNGIPLDADGFSEAASPSPGFLGRMGGGAYFNGNRQSFVVGNVTAPGVQLPPEFTLQAMLLTWLAPLQPGMIFYNRESTGGCRLQFSWGDGEMYFDIADATGQSGVRAGDLFGPYNYTSAWGNYYATVAGPSASQITLWNSPETGDPTEHWGQHTTATGSAALSVAPGNSLANVGTGGSGDPFFKGIMDELRLSSLARAAAWIQAEVNNTAWYPWFWNVLAQETNTPATPPPLPPVFVFAGCDNALAGATSLYARSKESS